MRDAFVGALTEAAARDARIMLLTADLGFNVLDPFVRRFPRQFLNVGVAEQSMAGLATGLALDGRVVFTYSIANFPTLRCLEQIRSDVCYHEANVKITAVGGGFSYGALGVSHHATEDLAILRAIPGLTVVAPGDLWEAREATRALATMPGPAYLRLDKSAAPPTHTTGERFELGRARRLREGTDLTLIATGGILGEVLAAADHLQQEGIRCRVLSMHTVQPLDGEALARAAAETGGILTVEEHTVRGGLGGAVAEELLEAGPVPARFHRLGLRNGFGTAVGSQAYMRARYGLDCAAIAAAARSSISNRQVVRPRGPSVPALAPPQP
jgi:transketolase